MIDEARRQVKEAQDLVPLARLPAMQTPSRYVKSALPLVVVDMKGKGIAGIYLEQIRRKESLSRFQRGSPREPSL